MGEAVLVEVAKAFLDELRCSVYRSFLNRGRNQKDDAIKSKTSEKFL